MRLRLNIIVCTLVALLLTGCYEDAHDNSDIDVVGSTTHIVLTFVTSNNNSSTRSAANDPDGYEDGTGYENYIDFDGGDYRIYFFTYEEDDEKGGTLIAEFSPAEITSSGNNNSTIYMVTGDVPPALRSVRNFRVLVLANWGVYPRNVTAGTTTIDDLCEGMNTTFNGRSMLSYGVSADRLIPFYGVCEYSNVEFNVGEKTTLSEEICLLRAVAKLEVVLTEDSSIESFTSVRIMACNRYGYKAPKDVYLKSDYVHDDDPTYIGYTTSLHLSNDGKNDADARTDETYEFIPQSDATTDTRVAYMAEYDNSGDDYSYIQVRIGNVNYIIYFGNYTDGVCTAYDEGGDTSDRLDIFRNNLYRFYITYKVEEEHEFYVDLTIINDKTEGYFNNVSHFE